LRRPVKGVLFLTVIAYSKLSEIFASRHLYTWNRETVKIVADVKKVNRFQVAESFAFKIS